VNAADLTQKRHPAPDLDERMFDASRFPLVRLRPRAVKPGYAFAWSAQMRRVLALATPFVIVEEYAADETPGDLQLRTAWLRTHRAQLAMLCRGIVVIEPRIEARASTRETLRAMTGDSAVRTVVVSSMRVAGELAPVLLKHSATTLAPAAPAKAERQKAL
jgi:hypothetical protein